MQGVPGRLRGVGTCSAWGIDAGSAWEAEGCWDMQCLGYGTSVWWCWVGMLGAGVAGAWDAVPGMLGAGVAVPGMLGAGVAVPGMLGAGVAVPGMLGAGVAVPGMLGAGVAVPGMLGAGVAVPGMWVMRHAVPGGGDLPHMVMKAHKSHTLAAGMGCATL